MIGTSKNISGFDPRTIAKCCLWLDGADPKTLFSDAAGTTNSTLNGLVAFWKDKSDANASVSNATSGERPTYISAGVSYASATNSGKGLYGTPPILSSGGVSAFLVYNPTSMTSGTARKCMVQLYTRGGYLVGFDNWYPEISIPSGYAYRYIQTTTGSNHLMSVVSYNKNVNNNGNTITQLGWDIGNLGSTSWTYKNDGTNNSSNVISIGARLGNVNSFDGTISEVIIYDSFLTVEQKQVVQRYLARKWNTQQQSVTPLTIPNCVLWNDASTLTGTGSVGTWPNPAGATTVACGGTKTPNGRNGLMTVRLTTAQTWVPNPVIATPAVTLFWSGRQTAGYGGANGRVLQGTANNHLYGYWGGYKRSVYNNNFPGLHVSGKSSDTEWDTFSYSRVADGAYTFSWNGSLQASGSTSTGSWMDGLVINTGASPNETSACEIGEIILYNRVLSLDERTLIELYLERKWNRSQKYPLNFPLDTVSPRLRAFQPNDFRDCYYWLDAAQDTTALGTNVSILPDWSGSNAPSSLPFQGSISLQANGRNGLPVYNFGSSRTLTSPGFVWNSSFTQFAVVQCDIGKWFTTSLVPDNNTYYNYVLAGNDALYYDTVMQVNDSGMPPNVANRSVFEYASGGKTSWVIFCIGHRSGDSNLTNYTVNGTVLSSTAGTASSITNVGKLVLNGNASAAFDTTKVAEFIHYNRSLSQGERQQVEGYLSKKWNIALPSAVGFSPASITGCQLWLDADDTSTTTLSGSSVTAWNDKSGNNRHMNTLTTAANWTPSTAAYPTIGTPIGGRRTINFTAQAGLKQSTTLDGVKNLFWVGRIQAPVGTPGSTSFFLLGHDVNYDWHGNPMGGRIMNTTFANSGIYNASPVSLIESDESPIRGAIFSNVNMPVAEKVSLLSAGGITGTTRYQGICYDRNGGNIGWCGDLAEVIVYSNALTIPERTQVENYLLDKWKIAYHPFKTLRPDVAQVFTPATLSRCQLWLDGRDPAGTDVIPVANSTVSTWIDKSGNMNHGTAVGTPTYLAEGGVNFDGTAYLSNTTLKMTLANRSVFIVAKMNVVNCSILVFVQTPSNTGYDFGERSGLVYAANNNVPAGFYVLGNIIAMAGYSMLIPAISPLPKAIYNDNMNTVVGSGYLNGSNVANNTAGYSATTCSGYLIGSRWFLNEPTVSGSRLNGFIYEIIAYDRGLTNSERQQVEGYLAWKWRLSSSLPTNHPFYKVSPGPALRSIMLNPDELYLWLDASDLSTLYQNPVSISPVTASGQTVGIWLDKSGKQRHYLAYSGTYPTYSTKSQVPELEFRTAGTNMTCTFLPPGCRPLDIFVVTQPLTSTGDWRTLFRGNNNDHHVIIEYQSYRLGAYYNQGGGFYQYGSYTVDGSRRVIIHVSISSGGIQSGSVTQLGEAYDGMVAMSAAASANANDNIYWIGGTYNVQPWGNISEFLVFQRNLANQEKIEVFNYLNSKWLTRVTLKNAIDYLPLATNATNLGTTPNTVTTVGNVTYQTVSGKQCAYFDNSFGMYLWFPYVIIEKFTICFWLRPFPVPPTSWTAVSITNTALTSPVLQIDLGTNNTTLVAYAAIPSAWSSTSGGSASNAWTHYTVTVNSITYVMELYVNGANRTSVTGSGAMPRALENRIVLGRSGDGSRAYQGYIRQFALFNTILTPYEVQDIFNATA